MTAAHSRSPYISLPRNLFPRLLLSSPPLHFSLLPLSLPHFSLTQHLNTLPPFSLLPSPSFLPPPPSSLSSFLPPLSPLPIPLFPSLLSLPSPSPSPSPPSSLSPSPSPSPLRSAHYQCISVVVCVLSAVQLSSAADRGRSAPHAGKGQAQHESGRRHLCSEKTVQIAECIHDCIYNNYYSYSFCV